ncbi:MAG: sel1 repeat family protein [Hyphomicrobiaceae bacterium]
MRVSRIEVIPHARDPVGNFAVIKLHGISQLNGAPHFQLAPLELAHAADSGWPTGDLKPLGVRSGKDLVELLIGPEIVKAAALRPGVSVHFRMPSVGADSQIVWPDLAGDVQAAAHPTMPRAPVPGAGAPLVLPSATTAGALPRGTTKSATDKPAAEQGLSRLKLRGPAAAAANAAQPPAAASPDANQNPQQPPAAVLKPTAITKAAPGNRQIIMTNAAPSASPVMNALPFGLGLIIVAAMLLTFLRTTEIDGSGVTLYAALRSAAAEPGATSKAGDAPSAVLSKIFDVGPTSPFGVDAAKMTRKQALDRANDLLATAQTPQEREEAAYWLRKALSHRLSEPRLVWALTQLGTAYASTDETNKPNYAAAHLLWGWAADAGDAQAACFLGRLYERGLGVMTDPGIARTQYERAQRLGGCPGLDQALLRVGKKS